MLSYCYALEWAMPGVVNTMNKQLYNTIGLYHHFSSPQNAYSKDGDNSEGDKFIFTLLWWGNIVSLFLTWVWSWSSRFLLWPCQPLWYPQSQMSAAGSLERGHSAGNPEWFQWDYHGVSGTSVLAVLRACPPRKSDQYCCHGNTAWSRQVTAARPVCKGHVFALSTCTSTVYNKTVHTSG